MVARLAGVMITTEMIRDGLVRLGLDKSSSVLVHASLRSFGRVDGGTAAVCDALVDVRDGDDDGVGRGSFL
jgi:aminoglycoside N3'-acetyltransferase